MSEALRQQALMAELFGASPHASTGCAQRGERRRRGLAAYRANAAAIAERTIAARHPCLHALIGGQALGALARSLWRADPPQRGDLAQWGHALAGYLEAQSALAEWPYLGDVARIETALAQAEAAEYLEPQLDSLAWLAECEPQRLRLCLQPHVQVLASRWPVVRIHAAHAAGADAGAFEAARVALALGEADAAVVSRHGWRGVVARIDAATWSWMDALAHGDSLADALACAGTDFDLAAWLARAIDARWLWRAELLN